MKNMFGAIPIVSLAMIAAISTAQVIISIRANVPKIALGVPFTLQAYCRSSEKFAASIKEGLSVEIPFVMASLTSSPGTIKSVWVSGVG
jgi:hypothetical protein